MRSEPEAACERLFEIGFDDPCPDHDGAPDRSCDLALGLEFHTPDAHAEHPGYEAAFSHPSCRESPRRKTLEEAFDAVA